MKNLIIRLLGLLGLLIVLGLLTACGNSSSGGGGGSTPADPGSSNWDEMVWDQDDWA